MKHCEIQIVTPHWVLDCVESSQLLSTEKYHPSPLKSSPPPSQVACNGALPSNPTSSALSMPVSIDSLVLTAEVPASGSASNEAFQPRRRKSSSQGERSLVRQASQPVHGTEEQAGIVGNSKYGENTEGEEVSGEPLPPESNASSSEKLLDGIVICFIDYQECVEDNTLEKWKLVS